MPDATTRIATDRSEPTPAAPADIAFVAALIRLISLVAGIIGTLEVLAGVLAAEPRAVGLGGAAVGYAAWVATRVGGLSGPHRERTLIRIAVGTLAVIAIGGVLQPSLATALAIGSILPAVIVTPLVSSQVVLRLLILSGLVGAWSVLVAEVAPANRIPADLQSSIAFLTLTFAYAFLIIFLWEVSRRLKNTAADLRSVITMSGNLAETLEPQLVGDLIAVHIARAVGADDCALSYWDRATDLVVTLGYDPPERRLALNESYPLDDFPATRRVLLEQQPLLIDVDDPSADAAEVAYLHSIGQRTMAMIPLVAAGRTIGLVEVTAVRKNAFGSRAVQLATMLAGEAAMALENARLYDEIRHQALHDGLTGLANRVLFRDRVEHAVARSRRTGSQLAVLFIDLDDFKTLNDTHGHDRGDEVLALAARRVSDVLRPSDTAARHGGDEFAILIEDVEDEDAALAVAIRLAEALRQPMSLGHAEVRIAASIGVALGGAANETADELLRNADVAMYAAKGSSRGGAEIFRPALRDGAAERAERAGRLRGVEERDELRLDYQPIVDLATNRIEAVEALVRWQPPDGPVLMPSDWIDLAEESGDIVPIGRWILREACRQARDWQIRLGRTDLRVSVNLSARQFREHDIVATVRTILDETGLPPQTLILEITESGLMRRTQATIARLGALRDLGVHLAIDDFGTGYSSLSYLERFPIDILKIDRTFVSPVGTAISPIARAIVDLGRTLGLQVVAEGVEHVEQARWLIELGCRYGQGYLYARPVGAVAIEALLAEGDGLARPAETDREVGAGASIAEPVEAPRLRIVGGE
ncbi:MAG: EAL domain-containing protein [Chloroflexi bacterium]|nr:EAL domain-containing protein [Chloroflexota bacterium]